MTPKISDRRVLCGGPPCSGIDQRWCHSQGCTATPSAESQSTMLDAVWCMQTLQRRWWAVPWQACSTRARSYGLDWTNSFRDGCSERGRHNWALQQLALPHRAVWVCVVWCDVVWCAGSCNGKCGVHASRLDRQGSLSTRHCDSLHHHHHHHPHHHQTLQRHKHQHSSHNNRQSSSKSSSA